MKEGNKVALNKETLSAFGKQTSCYYFVNSETSQGID